MMITGTDKSRAAAISRLGVRSLEMPPDAIVDQTSRYYLRSIWAEPTGRLLLEDCPCLGALLH